MATLARATRSAWVRLKSFKIVASDEFRHEEWSAFHQDNACFDRNADGSGDICKMLQRRMAGRAISEINERCMAGTETLRNKAVLEIGFGGGWYLAQALREGAKKVHGFEVADNIIRSTSHAFEQLGLDPYAFYKADRHYLNALPPDSVDVAFCVAVFQYIHPRVARGYLRTSARVIKRGSGYCLFQFLMNEDPARNPATAGPEGLVSYTKEEVDRMVYEAGLRPLVYAETWHDSSGTGNYWGWYKLVRASTTWAPAQPSLLYTLLRHPLRTVRASTAPPQAHLPKTATTYRTSKA